MSHVRQTQNKNLAELSALQTYNTLRKVSLKQLCALEAPGSPSPNGGIVSNTYDARIGRATLRKTGSVLSDCPRTRSS